MKTWRERIDNEIDCSEHLWSFMKGGGLERDGRAYALQQLISEAAEDVHREDMADCDPPALARRQSRLLLLLAFRSP